MGEIYTARRTSHHSPIERNHRGSRLYGRSSRIALHILALLVRRRKRDISSPIQVTRDIAARQTGLVGRVDDNRSAQEGVRLGEESNIRIAVSKRSDFAVGRTIELAVFTPVCAQIKTNG